MGDVAEDPLFLEAERLGIDIRDEGEAEKGKKDAKTMLFGFFPTEEIGGEYSGNFISNFNSIFKYEYFFLLLLLYSLLK